MGVFTQAAGSFSYAAALRQELSFRNREYAKRFGLVSRESYGTVPVICYMPSEDRLQHGNFLPQTYRAILNNAEWRKRLEKPHTSARRALPREDRRWRELDSSTSSDALLMNVFCFPATLKEGRVFDLLGVEPSSAPHFGIKTRVALASGGTDRTEVDMRLGDLLVEAKLTESDFQQKAAPLVERYRDFAEVFDSRQLPMQDDCYLSYQLIRNVLAAHGSQCSFCVMTDARRPDLREAWYAILRSVRIPILRLGCKMLTWQELARVLPDKLQRFLGQKYGIVAGKC